MGAEQRIGREEEETPQDEFRRIMGSLAPGCLAGILLPIGVFRLLQAFMTASAARFGEALVYLLIAAWSLWAGNRSTGLWRFSFAGVALVMAIALLSHATGIEGLRNDGSPVYGARAPGEEHPAFLAAGASVAMAIGVFLFGGVRAMRRRRRAPAAEKAGPAEAARRVK
jgi:hypothetical protein